MNARKVLPSVTAALALLATAAFAQPRSPCMTVSPVTFGCVKDSQGQPIYSWQLTVANSLVCKGGGSLQVTPGVLPTSFTIPAPGTSTISLATFSSATTSLNFVLSGCGLACEAETQLPLPTNCGQCMSVWGFKPPACKGVQGNLCTYAIAFNLTNSTDVPGVVTFHGAIVSPATVNVLPGANAISVDVTAPCGSPVNLTAQLSLGGRDAPTVCQASLPITLPQCPNCNAVAKPQDAKLCAPDSTQIDLQPPVPAGAITWYNTTSCPTSVQAPSSPTWSQLSGGTSWYTLGLSQTTCYQALISGVPDCPDPLISNVAQVDVVQPASPGPLMCTVQGGGPCPPKMCSPTQISLQANTAPGCSLQWQQNGQNLPGATSPVLNPPPLVTSTCQKSPASFTALLTCAPCPVTAAGLALEVYRPSVAGQLTAVKPTICAGDDDVVNLIGECGDSIQWQISQNGNTWSPISGALGPTTWLTNKLFLDTWYRVEVANGPCAAVFSNPVRITVTPKPTVTISASGPTQLCAPGSVVLTASATPPGGTYQWYRDGLPITTPATVPTLTVTQSGNYSVVYSTGCGKAKSNRIKVFVSKVVAAISGPCGACPPACIGLQGIAAGGKPAYSYSWSWLPSGSATGPTLNQCPTVPTTYSLTVTDALGCTGKATQNVAICPKFQAKAGANRTIAAGTSTTLGGSPTASGGSASYTYAWTPAVGLNNPAIANPVAQPAATTTYTVVVTDAKGCKATANVKVTVKAVAAPEKE